MVKFNPFDRGQVIILICIGFNGQPDRTLGIGGALGVFTAGCLCRGYVGNQVGTAVDFNVLIFVPST